MKRLTRQYKIYHNRVTRWGFIDFSAGAPRCAAIVSADTKAHSNVCPKQRYKQSSQLRHFQSPFFNANLT